MAVYMGAVPTPWGEVYYAVSEKGAVAITTPGQKIADLEELLVRLGLAQALEDDRSNLHQVGSELLEYFHGERQNFTFPLDEVGTAFQLQVWQALRQVPYGSVNSYKEIAMAIGKPKACRAIGQANAKNPLPIVTPCHRICAADGSLGGFAGGLECKQQLLDFEQKHKGGPHGDTTR
ncbi:MAG: methylated-DNA--[protein]-cysteine S-methyltransferase [Thermaerobacter sp.]|nr:methylated-DNA--[protein]-cysteine S-methyltransferase [Thermaerobacter sp.]